MRLVEGLGTGKERNLYFSQHKELELVGLFSFCSMLSDWCSYSSWFKPGFIEPEWKLMKYKVTSRK
jgi:hypothetical protein